MQGLETRQINKVLFLEGFCLVSEGVRVSEISVLHIYHKSVELSSQIVIQKATIVVKHFHWSFVPAIEEYWENSSIRLDKFVADQVLLSESALCFWGELKMIDNLVKEMDCVFLVRVRRLNFITSSLLKSLTHFSHHIFVVSIREHLSHAP